MELSDNSEMGTLVAHWLKGNITEVLIIISYKSAGYQDLFMRRLPLDQQYRFERLTNRGK